ncbi:MAG: YfhO family protein, partial [Rikenellaceae bacterium]|nr:YfhO family protein [Rikenellaceae bacterium]
AWGAPMVGAVWYAYRRHMWLGAALAGLFAAVEISTSHPQITYYFLFVILALVINEFVVAYKDKMLARFGKATAVLALAAALAVGANLVQLYYVAQHTPETTRGRSELTEATVDTDNHTGGLDRDYITAWSYGKLETLNLLVPNLYGGGRDFAPDGEVAQSLRGYDVPRGFEKNLPSYWGDQPSTDGPVYLGACLVFLAVFGLFVLRGRQKWWIAAVSVLAIFLAWGRHMMWFTNLFLDYFPMYNKFRTVSMILVIVEWAVPLLAMLGLARLWTRDDTDGARIRKGLKWSLIIVGGLTLLVGIFGPMFSSFTGAGDEVMGLPEQVVAAMQEERASLMRTDAFRSLFFVAVTAGLVWLFAAEKIKRGWLVAGLCVIVVADLFPVDKRYVSADDFHPKRQALAIPMTEADKLILQDTTDYRVANFTLNPFTDATTSYYHRSVGGYHAAKLRRYQDLIDHHLSRNNMAVYDMLNTKYFIVPGEGGQPTVQRNPYACGSAWFVDSIAWVENADREIAALNNDGKGGGFDPHTTAVVDRRFASQLEGLTPALLRADSAATITLTEYRVNRQTYKTRAAQDGVAVLSEIYYPKGWTATIDGRPAEYFRADYVLRAIRVPAGEHTVEFSFAAPHFGLLVAVTRASSAILLFGALGLLIGIGMRGCKRNEENGGE